MEPRARVQGNQEKRLGWKSYAVMAIVAGITASRFHKQLRRPQGFQNEAKWYAPSESDLRQEYLDQVERKERVARVQGAYDSLRSNYRINMRAVRYKKWEEHPTKEDTEEKTKENAASDHSKLAERTKLRHHYIVLGLNPFREEAFTEDEIKAAFRERALQFHPDKNPENKEEMRAKFRDLMESYKAIKSEKKIS